jgi:hypothetical protein
MNDNEPSPPRVVPPSHRRTIMLTQVELTWIEKKIEHWLRFGRRAEEKILDRRRSISSFRAPRKIAALASLCESDR